MNKVKYFFKMHTKECMLGFCLSLCLIIVLGTYYFCNKEESATKFLVDSQSFESPVLKKVSTSVDTTGNNQEEIGEDKIEDTEETNAVVTEEKIRVDIKGHVFNPGVYEAIKDDRVIDIITKAGGLLPDADTSVNNLSRRVWDEMVIIIYSSDEVKDFSAIKEKEKQEMSTSNEVKDIILNDATLKIEDIVTNQDEYNVSDNQNKNTSSNISDKQNTNSTSKETVNSSNNKDIQDKNSQSTKKISINTASKTELMNLSGIGESKAQAIISYRDTNGMFKKIEDIMKVKGIGEKIFEKIKDNITL